MRTFFILHVAVLLYSMSTACGKFATGNPTLSPAFFLWFGAEIMLMGVYALIWQQVIKTLDLGIAYSNKALTLIWTLLFSVVFFENTVTPGKVVGILLAITGTVLMNKS